MSGRWLACATVALAAALGGPPARGDEPDRDPLQQAVVDSLSFPRRTTPPELLDAVIRATQVEAHDVAIEAFARLATLIGEAGDARLDLLADLGEAFPAADLASTERLLAPHEPGVVSVFRGIRDSLALRRRDPRRIAAATADLASPDKPTRAAAFNRLREAREDALPELVGVLADPATGQPARAAARRLLDELGPTARQPLLAWLGSMDTAAWPGVIAALDASRADDVADFLLAPALVPDTPAAARTAALESLARRTPDMPSPPAIDEAVARLTERLDRVLTPAGMPEVDHLLLEPVTGPDTAAAAFGGAVTGLVERFVWNPAARRLERGRLPPRAARAQEAIHVARDLMALKPSDEAAIRLAILARFEVGLVFAGDPETAADRIGPAGLREALAGPAGFDADTAAALLDEAATRGMWEAAAAIATACETDPDDTTAEPLAPTVRKALVRALAVPDPVVQFAAARTLALAAGPPPWAGSSRVVEILLHAATATGIDRAVIAHPDIDVAHGLATEVSRFGYEPVRVSTGREAILAARTSADTQLVLVAARLTKPTALETVQLLQQQGVGHVPPILVVVDPLDDDGRGRFLTCLILKFCDVHRIAIVDRLDSFFAPTRDSETGDVIAPPRFVDAVAQAAGPTAVDPTMRAGRAAARLARADAAIAILARLGRSGQDVSAAENVARAALFRAESYASGLALLASIGRPEAQRALLREADGPDLPDDARARALAAFETSVARYGILLESRHLREAYGRYNSAGDEPGRAAAAAVLDVLEAPTRHRRPSPSATGPDAALPRSIR